MVPTHIVMISNTNVKVSLKSEFNLELKSFSYLKKSLHNVLKQSVMCSLNLLRQYEINSLQNFDSEIV